MKIPACLLTMSQKLWRGSNPFWEILRLTSAYSQKVSKKISSNDETFEIIDISKYTCTIQVQRRMDVDFVGR